MECSVKNQETKITKQGLGAMFLTLVLLIYLAHGVIKLYTPMFSPGFQEWVLETGWIGLIPPTWYLIILGFTYFVVIPQIKR